MIFYYLAAVAAMGTSTKIMHPLDYRANCPYVLVSIS